MCSNLIRNIPSKEILGVRIHYASPEILFQVITEIIREDHKAIVAHVNAHAMNFVYEKPWFKKFLNQSELIFCDGAGLNLAAYILGYPKYYRITYADWIWQLVEFVESSGFTFFFLGAAPGVAEKAATRIKEQFPRLHIVGTHDGYFDKLPGSIDNESIIQQINTIKPNILIVAFGMPLQEKWLMENWDRIEANVALTGGAVFDYVSGNLRRAPRWMTDHGMEWLGRLIIEPGRLWKRYLIGNTLFLWRVFKQKMGWIRYSQ